MRGEERRGKRVEETRLLGKKLDTRRGDERDGKRGEEKKDQC